jgi:hypothetical protein
LTSHIISFGNPHYTMGNLQSNVHEPSPYHSATSTTAPKSVKSAFKRTRSVQAEADRMEPAQDRTRYIPKMNRADNNGLIMPTRPFGPDATNGVDSPQWGWYINTTPPTPEMYHSHSSKTSKQQLGLNGAPSNPTSKSCHNQVFQNLQNSKAPIGWTSVPI